jgi:hypothetical protein
LGPVEQLLRAARQRDRRWSETEDWETTVDDDAAWEVRNQLNDPDQERHLRHALPLSAFSWSSSSGASTLLRRRLLHHGRAEKRQSQSRKDFAPGQSGLEAVDPTPLPTRAGGCRARPSCWRHGMWKAALVITLVASASIPNRAHAAGSGMAPQLALSSRRCIAGTQPMPNGSSWDGCRASCPD